MNMLIIIIKTCEVILRYNINKCMLNNIILAVGFNHTPFFLIYLFCNTILQLLISILSFFVPLLTHLKAFYDHRDHNIHRIDTL
jgi:hypothetical protein